MNRYFILFLFAFLWAGCQQKQQQNRPEDVQDTDTLIQEPIARLPFQSPEIPSSVEFAGETVPVDDISILERLDRELLINNFWHTRTFLTIKRSGRWFPLIERILKEHNVPDDFKYLAVAESGLENVTSPANAVGFWQFLKKTGKDYGLEVNKTIDERYHVEKATIAACKYLINAKNKLGSWTLAAAAYNRGKAGIENSLEEQQTDSYYDLLLNEETSRYLFRIIATKIIFEHPDQFGFDIPDKAMYQPYSTDTIKVSETIDDIAVFAEQHGSSYRIIKLLNPWIRKDKIKINNEEQSYTILVPSKESSLKIHGKQ